ncbi:hypothetical protein CY652_05995 [Burkholderia sp. WAC0059]|uniref:A24 family peptidase n=1 Tax=Burkholderia sp. WAC0059 TaxID=2066022 RepID=UPI000C7F629E|nr:prepilin peptidase [Burkholderia sp. WAC0059]PLZ03356.1 hypothetical protein CY652_05995 [Burkholderia sp. WAC0059]
MNMPLGGILFTGWAAAVAWCDCRSRRIPNALVVAGLLGAFVCALAGRGPFGLPCAGALLGAAAGLAALLPFFALGVMGAADVKVFAALGAWCGIDLLPGLWIVANLAAGLHALWLVARVPLAAAGQPDAQRRDAPARADRPGTPYAACLTVPAVAWLAVETLARSH